MTTVRLLTGLSGPFGNWQPGDSYECTAEEAARLIEAGFAESAGARRERAVKKPAPATRIN